MQRGAFLYLLHAGDIVVAAADYADDVFAANIVLYILKSGDGDGSRRLDDNRALVIEGEDRRAYLPLRHLDQAVDHFTADVESNISRLPYRDAVRKGVKLLKLDWLSRVRPPPPIGSRI